MLTPQNVLEAAATYLRAHPEEVTRAIRGGMALRFGMPLAALRWLVAHLVDDASGLEPVLEARPPGLFVAATTEQMETRMRISAVVYVTGIRVDDLRARMDLRVDDLQIDILSERKTVVAALIKSGALDVSQVGDLVRELPRIPDFIIEAEGQRLVIDLMRAPSLSNNLLLRHAIGLASALVTVRGVETEDDHVDMQLRPLPRGARTAMRAFRSHFVRPAVYEALDFVERWQRRRLSNGRLADGFEV